VVRLRSGGLDPHASNFPATDWSPRHVGSSRSPAERLACRPADGASPALHRSGPLLASVIGFLSIPPTVKSLMQPDPLQPEPRIADIVQRLLRDRSIDREFGFEDNLRDVGLTSLDMTSLVFAVEGDFAVEIPDRAITPANFTSVASIGRLIRTLAQHDAAQSAAS
jgi:acyl carrier protein